MPRTMSLKAADEPAQRRRAVDEAEPQNAADDQGEHDGEKETRGS